MQRLLAALAVSTCLPAFAEDRPPLATAIAAVRAEGHVFEIGNGHYLAIVTEPEGDFQWTAMFYGTARTLYQVPISTSETRYAESNTELSDGWAMRPDFGVSVDFVDARYEQPKVRMLPTRELIVTCGSRTFKTKELANGRALLRKAQLLAQLHKSRAPLRLARDEGTTYYYVDVDGDDDFARSPHLYIGKRGAMKPVKLVDYATDSAGQVLVTKAGTLHIDNLDARDQVRMSWTAPGKSPAPLREVRAKRELVFGDLGIYDGQRWDTPCDDLPLR